MNKEFDCCERDNKQFEGIFIPEMIITGEQFSCLSSDAKLLYGMMLSRVSMAHEKGHLDKQNRAYVLFPIEEVRSVLHCSKGKAIKILSELDSKNGVGLIERVRRGLGNPDIIYVKNYINGSENNVGGLKSDEESKTSNSPKCQESSLEFNKYKKQTCNDSKKVISKKQNLVSNYIYNNNYNYNNNNHNNNYNYIYPILSRANNKQEINARKGQDVNPIPVVILDITVPLDESEEKCMADLLENENGISQQWIQEPELMQKAIQLLGNWNLVNLQRLEKDEEWIDTYVCMVRNLIELCLTPSNIRVGNNRVVSYAKVIEQINSIYHKTAEGMKTFCLSMFFDSCVKRYREATMKRKIQKVDAYCKTLIWNTLCSFEVDWHGYFNMTNNSRTQVIIHADKRGFCAIQDKMDRG